MNGQKIIIATTRREDINMKTILGQDEVVEKLNRIIFYADSIKTRSRGSISSTIYEDADEIIVDAAAAIKTYEAAKQALDKKEV